MSLVWNASSGELPYVEGGPSPMPFHRALPQYAPTPLVELSTLAGELGVDAVWVKDESSRLGLPAFKILGASWAVYRVLRRLIGAESEPVGGFGALEERLAPFYPLRLVASTEGNHGRAVARVAAWLGFESMILIPSGADERRIDAIRGEGAEVVEVDGTYDDTVEQVRRLVGPRDLLIQDTAWDGYETIPRWVVQGYATMLLEVDEQLADRDGPTLVAVQCGVGSLASAVVTHYRRSGLGSPPALVSVEPLGAACVQASFRRGRRSPAPALRESIMAGLNCGEMSTLAWPVLRAGLDASLAIDDAQAARGVQELERGGISAGASGAAGLAGVLALRWATRDGTVTGRLAIGRATRILVFCTEAAG